MSEGSPPVSTGDRLDDDEIDADAPTPPEGSHRKSMKRGPLTAVACEACRKRKSKCDGARPVCSTCRSKAVTQCVYEAGVDGSRIQQLRKHNRDLKDEVASLQTQLSESLAQNQSSQRQNDREGASFSPEQLSPISEQRSGPLDQSPPYSSLDLVTRFQLIRAGGRGPRGFFMYQPQGSRIEGFDLKGGWNGLLSGFPSGQRPLAENDYSPIQPSIQQFDHESPISKVYSSFCEYARQAMADGEPESRVLGSFEVNAGVVFSNSNFENASYLSQWAGQVVSAWGLQSLAPKIGMMYLVSKLMRWQVSSSQQDFNDLPAMLKPTTTQLTIPHPPFIDFLIWPILRDLLITEVQTYEPIQWTEKVAQTLNLTRDFTFEEVLYGEPSTGNFRMQEPFRLYVENIGHWTLDPLLADLMPQLRGNVQFR